MRGFCVLRDVDIWYYSLVREIQENDAVSININDAFTDDLVYFWNNYVYTG